MKEVMYNEIQMEKFLGTYIQNKHYAQFLAYSKL